MTVAIYIRVSTDEQAKEGFSIGAQREMLKAYCQSQGWREFKYYVDEGISAKDTNRPQLQLMLKHIEQGMIKKVLVYRLDRITRSVRDLHELLETFENNNCAFVSSTEPYDTTTAMGKLFITLVAAIAQWERENTGERISAVLTEKAKSGEWLAQAPFGFQRKKDKYGQPTNELEHNEEEMFVLKDMIKKTLEGYSSRRLSIYLNDSGYAPKRGYKWHQTSVLEMLGNPVLYGAMRWKGKVYEGVTEGIMTKEEFDHLTKVIESRKNKKIRHVERDFVYQMKLICPLCENHLTSEVSRYTRKTDNKTIERKRYRCQVCALDGRKSTSVSEEKLDEAFVQYMKKLTIEEVPEVDKEPDKASQLKSKIAKIESQRERYQRAWASELITDKEFSERMNETKVILGEWKKELKEHQSDFENHIDPDLVKEIVNDFNKNWSYLNDKEKKKFLNMFIEGVKFSLEGRKITVDDVIFY